MTEFMTYALIGYMIGVLISEFVSAEVGRVVRIISATIFVLSWLLTLL